MGRGLNQLKINFSQGKRFTTRKMFEQLRPPIPAGGGGGGAGLKRSFSGGEAHPRGVVEAQGNRQARTGIEF